MSSRFDRAHFYFVIKVELDITASMAHVCRGINIISMRSLNLDV